MSLDPKRRFYLDGYGQHPEWYTWHYEMLKKLVNIDTSINNQTTEGISFNPTYLDSFGCWRMEWFAIQLVAHSFREPSDCDPCFGSLSNRNSPRC